MAAPKRTGGHRNANTKPAETAAPNPTENAPKAKAADESGIEGIWVRSVKASFRRCGMRFTREGMGIALDALEDGQLEILEREPNLIVERVIFSEEQP